MSKKMQILFNGFETLAETLDKISNDIKPATSEALKETQKFIAPKLHKAMQPHHRTGKTEKSIIDAAKIEENGNKLSIDVGFRIRQGGMPSIFLMHGTPRMEKDTRLYNALYGVKTRREIKELQTKIMNKYINLAKK